jgi:modulator of FtsH protease HflC
VKKHGVLIIVGLAIVGIVLLYAVTFTVRWQEQGLVLTFGKITAEYDQPGLKWVWPWQDVVKLDTRVRTCMPPAYQTQTRDKQPIICRLYVTWRIQNAAEFYNQFNKSGARQESDLAEAATARLIPMIGESMNVFAEYPLGELVTLDEGKFKLDTVEHGPDGKTGMLGRIRDKVAGGKYGIEVLDVGIRQLGVPDNVTQSVFKRMSAEREAEVTALMAAGRSQADSIVGTARGQAIEIKAKAEAQATAIQGEGDAKAAEYYAAFLQHPELANFLRKLGTLRTTLNERTTLVLDNETPPYNLLITGPQAGETGKPGQTAAPQAK